MQTTPGGVDQDPGALAAFLAREAVERYVRTGGRLDPPPVLPPSQNTPGAALVTLRMGGLRYGVSLPEGLEPVADPVGWPAEHATTGRSLPARVPVRKRATRAGGDP